MLETEDAAKSTLSPAPGNIFFGVKVTNICTRLENVRRKKHRSGAIRQATPEQYEEVTKI